MHLFEVIGLHSGQYVAFKHLPNSTSEVNEPRPSLLDLIYQALTRDGRVIAPAALKADFDQCDGRHEGDDEWMPDETPISPDNYHP